MSTIQERLGTVDRSTAIKGIFALLYGAGLTAVVLSAAVVYSVFILVSFETLTNAGVFETMAASEQRVFATLFGVPMLALPTFVGAHVFNLVSGYDLSEVRITLYVCGLWFVARIVWGNPLNAGVL